MTCCNCPHCNTYDEPERGEEFHISVSRDTSSEDWYIRVTDEGGFSLYDGAWRDSATKSAAEAVREAIAGALIPGHDRPSSTMEDR